MGKFPRQASTARAMGLLVRAARCALDTETAPVAAASVLIEKLEKRELLSISAHRPLARLDSMLQYAYQDYLESSGSAVGAIQVQAYANPGDRAKLATAVKNLHATDISGTGREVDALVPISSLGKLATVGSLRTASAAEGVANSGSVTSQGDLADIAATARSTYNLSGAGVTIGILSDSFNNNINKSISDTYTTDVASGDLPANVQILSDNVPGTDEGRAIAQVIYDSAPGATIKFETAAAGMSTMASSITALANAGCKLIVDDYSYITDPMFEDGAIAQAITAVIARGVTYISAAGNLASQSYASSWSTGKSYTQNQISRDPSATNAPGTMYNGSSFSFTPTYSAGTDMDSFTLGPSQSINLSLQWDQPYYSAGGSANAEQLDGYVLNSTGTMIEGGSVAYSVGGDPVQHIFFTNPSTSLSNSYKLLIISEHGFNIPGQIKFVDFSGQSTGWTYALNSSTIFGHANAAGVITVGAVNYANTPTYNNNSTSKLAVESYSSTGGTPILFNTSGARITTGAVYRQEPVIAGPDDVSNTFFNNTNSNIPPPYSFSGTSAGAASTAGVVALLMQINPYLTPAQVYTDLVNTAIHIGTAPNNSAGYGFVQTVPAVAAVVGNVTGTVFSDNKGTGVFNTGDPGIKGVTVYLDESNSGQLQSGDPTAITSSNGSFGFYNVPTGTTVVRAVVPGGYVATNNGATISIVGATTTSNVNIGLFPVVFNASSTAYTIQRDVTTPANEDIYIGSVLTYAVPFADLNTLTFNLGGGNTSLTTNFSSGSPVPSGGVTYEANATTTGNVLVVNGTSGKDTADVNYQVTTFNGALIVASGVNSQTINGLNGNATYSISGAEPPTESLTFNGSGSAVGNATLTVNDVLPNNGVGTVFNAGTNASDQNTLTVNMGAWTFSGDPAAASADLTVNDNSDVIFAAGAAGGGVYQRNLAALNIGPLGLAAVALPASHGSRAVLVTNSLSIGTDGVNTGTLDLGGNDLIVTSGSLGTITSELSAGFAGGSWAGSGIQSTAAASDTTFLTALGSLQNNITGSPLFGSGAPLGLFDGVSPAASAILVKYTYYGDTNLDGFVDGTDYSRTDSGSVATATGWFNGDFNYDGSVNGSDYTLLDNVYNLQGNSM